MNKEELLARREQAEQRFNDVQKEIEEHNKAIGEAERELDQLRGRYSALTEIIEKPTEVKTKKAKKTAANVIDATEVEVL